MTSLNTEKSFETLAIDEARVLMLKAWDNYKGANSDDKVDESEDAENKKIHLVGPLPEVDRIRRILDNVQLKNVKAY